MATRDRIGFHYYPDDAHYTQRDLERWLPVLLRLSANWIVLRAGTNRAVPEDFIRGLLGAGIRPIVHIPCEVGSAGSADLASLIASYGSWGVRDLIVYDRPNLRSQWQSADWSRPGLVERFVDRLLPVLQLQRSAGMQPVFPALEPGGDYWDTAFLQSALRSMLRRGASNLVQDMRLASFAWSYGHPLDWGSGGAATWPEGYPYARAEHSQNQRGFRSFDWYAEISQSVVGRTLPMIVIAGGSAGPRELLPEVVTSAVRAVMGRKVPDSVIAFNFHLLAADPGAPEYAAAWYADPNEPKPIVSAVERMLNAVAHTANGPVMKKALRHYVLLPKGGLSDLAWNSVRATVTDGVFGDSAEEAEQASLVTIVGDESAIPPSVERKLIEAGSQVRRVAPQHPIWQQMRRDASDG